MNIKKTIHLMIAICHHLSSFVIILHCRKRKKYPAYRLLNCCRVFSKKVDKSRSYISNDYFLIYRVQIFFFFRYFSDTCLFRQSGIERYIIHVRVIECFGISCFFTFRYNSSKLNRIFCLLFFRYGYIPQDKILANQKALREMAEWLLHDHRDKVF